MNTPNNITVGHAAYHPDCNLPSPAMIPTAPDCGSPCAMCESYAHLLAKAREEIARLREEKRQLEAFRDYVQKFGDYWKAFERRAAIDAAKGGAK